MEPSFWSWEKRRFDPWLISKICAAMEPSFWSWEKPEDDPWSEETWAAAMEPSFWSWEKWSDVDDGHTEGTPQWSPAFGAGKRARDFFTN